MAVKISRRNFDFVAKNYKAKDWSTERLPDGFDATSVVGLG